MRHPTTKEKATYIKGYWCLTIFIGFFASLGFLMLFNSINMVLEGEAELTDILFSLGWIGMHGFLTHFTADRLNKLYKETFDMDVDDLSE